MFHYVFQVVVGIISYHAGIIRALGFTFNPNPHLTMPEAAMFFLKWGIMIFLVCSKIKFKFSGEAKLKMMYCAGAMAAIS